MYEVTFFSENYQYFREDCTFEIMKFLQYTYYFLRSLFLRGILNTFKLLSYEGKYENRLGIKTHHIVNLDQLTLAGDESHENHHYQGASYYILFSIFKQISEKFKSKTFIDFGCGKGRALFAAEYNGFTKLIGVDIAKELIDFANENKKLYQQKNPESSIEFVFEDATKYQIPNDASVFYFFNPFGETIMHQVISNIKDSVSRNPREIICIYLNPKYKAVFENNGFYKVQEIKSGRYLEGIIFSLNVTSSQ